MSAQRRPRRLRRGGYLLPSLFTSGNMLLGFYAIVRGFRGDYWQAAILILIAGVVDGLDGRIARLTGTESEFGKEYDALADLLTFGAAPALLAFFWGLEDFGRIGWLVPLFYLVCTATRLARFNVQTRVVDSRYFVGLPCPAAAAALASLLFYAPDREWRSYLGMLVIVALVCLGILMVSTFRYHSFKQIDLRKRWSYRMLLPVAAVLLVVAVEPPAFFLVVAILYALSGPVGWAWNRLRRREARGASDPEPPPAGRAPEDTG